MTGVELIDAVLRANLVAALAILVVVALRAPVRRGFGARMAYGLWLLPPLLAAASLVPFPRDEAWPAVPLVVSASMAPSIAHIPSQAWRLVVLCLWPVGAIGCAAVLGLRQVRFMAGLGRLSPTVVDGREVLRAAHPLAGPAVVGGSIVVPADFEQRFTPEERDGILTHETAHLVRGDVAANLLASLIQCLCWFNPLVHLAVFQCRIDQELACDATVIQARPHARRSYAEALLKSQFALVVPPVGCLWPSRAAHPLKQRIAMLKSPPPSPARRALGVFALGVLVLGGGYAAWGAQPAAGHAIARPDWVERPSGADMVRFYPGEAARRGLPGMATVQCRVQLTGALTACRVLRQSPEGAGFGQAALDMTSAFRMKPLSRDGIPVAGGVVRIPVKFAIHH